MKVFRRKDLHELFTILGSKLEGKPRLSVFGRE
jgi:hypothetical protein